MLLKLGGLFALQDKNSRTNKMCVSLPTGTTQENVNVQEETFFEFCESEGVDK